MFLKKDDLKSLVGRFRTSAYSNIEWMYEDPTWRGPEDDIDMEASLITQDLLGRWLFGELWENLDLRKKLALACLICLAEMCSFASPITINVGDRSIVVEP